MEMHATTGRRATARRRVTRPAAGIPPIAAATTLSACQASGRHGQLARFADADRQLRHMADGAGLVEMELRGLAATR